MVDAQGRPCFLGDVDMTVDELTRQLAEADLPVRAYLIGKVTRQAKADDALQFITAQQMKDLWPHLESIWATRGDFWRWLIEEWKRRGMVRG
jgi:hypothetical protein